MAFFDINATITYFKQCYEEGLTLEAYNQGYKQLHTFFLMLGRVFGFIGADVIDKINILNDYRNSEKANSEYYEKIEPMMLHEIEVNKETGHILHGSRTLLRLHRALKFTMLFLQRFAEMGDNESTAVVATTAYKESLAEFHPWYIRKPAQFAMYTLPSKEDLLKVLQPEGNVDEITLKKNLKSCVDAIKPVYIMSEELYTKYDLHGLP